MKIAYVIPGIQRVGPVIVIQNLVKYLVKNKKAEKIDVYYLYDVKNPVAFDCKVHRISYLKPFNFDDYDIIHTHMAKADLYGAIWSWKIKHAKLITTIHQDTFVTERYRIGRLFSPLYVYTWMLLQRLFYNGVIFISKQIYDTYERYYKCTKKVIYNGVYTDDTIPVNQEFSIKIKELKAKGLKMLGTYALIMKRKGIIQVLRFLEQNKDYGFVVIGDGDEKEILMKRSKDLGVSDRVLFLPHVKNPYCYLDDIDIYTMTSYSEAFGLAMVEAALSGKPIVCSNLPSFHEIFAEDEACFFELDNIPSLSTAISKAYSNKELLGQKAKGRAEACFTAQINAENHLNYYAAILNTKSLGGVKL